jgi:hypothetical protein
VLQTTPFDGYSPVIRALNLSPCLSLDLLLFFSLSLSEKKIYKERWRERERWGERMKEWEME